MVFLWFSYGFPMVSLWFSYGFPMVFLWFHRSETGLKNRPPVVASVGPPDRRPRRIREFGFHLPRKNGGSSNSGWEKKHLIGEGGPNIM